MAATAFMLDDGDCKVGQSAPATEVVRDTRRPIGPISITKTVGLNAPNVFDDVFKIQHELDRIAPIDGGPDPPLVVDGKCGPKTNKAIRDFQIKHFGFQGADGRIDPNKRTIQKINELKNDNIFPSLPLSFANPTDKGLFDGMMQHIPHTKNCVRAAIAKILLAMTSVDSPGGLIGPSREERMRLINKHFKIDSARGPGLPALQKINDVYSKMLGVLNRPENFFTLDTDNSGETISTVAFARLGGFFDKKDFSGRIVFRRGVLFATAIPDFAAFIFIHELRHFVEQEGQNGHFGKGWVTDPAMAKLKPPQTLANCDTYSGFALEANNGEMQRPVFIKSSVFR